MLPKKAGSFDCQLFSSSGSFLKKGMRNTKQATRKKMLPNNAQKLPMLAMQNPIAETINNNQPIRLMVRFDIIHFPLCYVTDSSRAMRKGTYKQLLIACANPLMACSGISL